MSNSNNTAPTATAIIDADVTGFAGITRSRPKNAFTNPYRIVGFAIQ